MPAAPASIIDFTSSNVRAAEAGLGVRDDGREVVDVRLPLHVLDLVRAHEGVVDLPDDVRDRRHGVEALVRIHRERVVRIARDLPAGEIDRLEAGLYLLHGLVARQRPEGADELLRVQQVPEPLGAHAGDRVVELHGPAEAVDLVRRVRADDALPAQVVGPGSLEFGDRLCSVHGMPSEDVRF